MRIFQLFDADQDGCLNFEEFIRAVESFGRLYTSEDKCMCELQSLLKQMQLAYNPVDCTTLASLVSAPA